MGAYVPRFETQTDQNAPLPWTNCTLASGAMLVDQWTYGRTRTNDIVLREHSGVPVNLGINFAALRRAIKSALNLDLRYSEWDGSGNAQMTWRQLRDHLSRDGGAVVAGRYEKLAAYKSTDGKSMTRWQPGGTFGHAVFVCDYDPETETLHWMDPLGRGGYLGDRVHIAALWAFIFKVGTNSDARITAAHSFTGTRPSRPTVPVAEHDHAGTISAFGTRYPEYVHSDADALAWVNRNIRRLREQNAIRGY